MAITRIPWPLHRLAPDHRRVRAELAVDDGVAAPRSVDLDEQPRRDLRRRRHDRLVALAGGDRALEPRRRVSQGRPPLRRRAAGRRRAATTRRASTSSVGERERARRVRGSRRASGAASAGIVRARSPRPSSTRSPVGASATAAGRASPPAARRRSIVGACSGRRRVAGWRRHTSRAIHRRSAGGSRCGGEAVEVGRRGRPRRRSTPREARRRRPRRRRRGARPAARSAAMMPMVRCDDADSTVSAAWGKPRGQVQAVAGRAASGPAPARRARRTSASATRGPARTGWRVRSSGSHTRQRLHPSSCSTNTSW